MSIARPALPLEVVTTGECRLSDDAIALLAELLINRVMRRGEMKIQDLAAVEDCHEEPVQELRQKRRKAVAT